MSEQQVSQEEVVRAVYGFAANLMRNGYSNNDIELALVKKGLSQKDAYMVVRRLDEERQSQYAKTYGKAKNDAAMRDMAIGGVICLIGLVVSIGSYQAAATSPTGGSYVVAWGAVIFGGIQFLRGLFNMMG